MQGWLIALAAFEEEDHALLGTVRNVAPPQRFGGRKLPASGNSPALGQHTEEILTALDK